MFEKGLIVSCQALEDEPLHSPYIMSRMAVAAKEGGAIGIRANSLIDIVAIKKVVDLPIIGIIKKDYEESNIYITPSLKEIDELSESGCEIIAMDASLDIRPNNCTLLDCVDHVRNNYPHIQIMADCSTLEEAKNADKLGFDYIGTTLVGYTEQSLGVDISNNDFELIREILNHVTKPVIAEGNIDTPDKAKRVLELGCKAVVVGSIITRPQIITRRFVERINS